MPGIFIRRSAVHKQRVNRKRSFKSTVLTQPESKESIWKYVSFPWPPLWAALSIFSVIFFLRNHFFFYKESIKHEGSVCRIVRFLKACLGKNNAFGSSVDQNVADKSYPFVCSMFRALSTCITLKNKQMHLSV